MTDKVRDLNELSYEVGTAAALVASALTPDVRLERMSLLYKLTREMFAAGIIANIDQVADKMEAEQDA